MDTGNHVTSPPTRLSAKTKAETSHVLHEYWKRLRACAARNFKYFKSLWISNYCMLTTAFLTLFFVFSFLNIFVKSQDRCRVREQMRINVEPHTNTPVPVTVLTARISWPNCPIEKQHILPVTHSSPCWLFNDFLCLPLFLMLLSSTPLFYQRHQQQQWSLQMGN